MGVVDQLISGVRHALWGPELRPLELFPRKPENVFESDVTLKKLLPDQFEAIPNGFSPDLKRLEIHFYPDLGTKRTITAFVSKLDDKQIIPESGRKVYFRLAPGSASGAKLNTNEVDTDDKGFAAVEIEHPAETPTGLQLIFLQASLNESFQGYVQQNLLVCRNLDVSEDLSQVISGNTLLVKQSQNLEISPGVKQLQKLLNQVVARKKSAKGFKWLAMNGKYDTKVTDVVKEFLSKFSGGFDYEKGKFDAKVDDLVKDYIKSEYGEYVEGSVVDRSLLVGTKAWSEGDPISEIDGLLDIYNGVVRRFFEEMIRVAETYTGCETFWLHRPMHKLYKKGTPLEARMKKSLSLHTDGNAESEILENESSGAAEKVSKGDKLRVVATNSSELKRWRKVRALPALTSKVWIHEEYVDELDGYKKLKLLKTAVLQNGTTAARKPRTDYNGNEIKVGAGTEVDGTRKKVGSDGTWYEIRLASKSGWVDSEATKLTGRGKWVSATETVKVHKEAAEDSGVLTDHTGTEISLSVGEKVAYLKKITPPGKLWLKVRREDGVEGWVPAAKCDVLTNDRAIAFNAGTFGMPGVAYSFGCKDRPNEYNQLLDGNTLKPSDIKCWQQYEKRHTPGKTNKDDDTINWTGVDCSGFTQNCATDSLLSDNTRIVPESRFKRIVRKSVGEEGGWAYNKAPVAARNFVGKVARQIPYDSNDAEKEWLDITDIITSEGHIVWVAEESPKSAGNQRDFQVLNAYGGFKRKNEKPRIPTDKFLRKVIKMPFKWWGVYCGGDKIKLGRMYFWS